MQRLREFGHAPGEYLGGGQGDGEQNGHGDEDPEVLLNVDAEPDADDGLEQLEEDSNEDAHPLLFFYDCEATGFSIYEDHITEIAAKVVGVPLGQVSQPSYSSLVHTPRYIPKRVSLF